MSDVSAESGEARARQRLVIEMVVGIAACVFGSLWRPPATWEARLLFWVVPALVLFVAFVTKGRFAESPAKRAAFLVAYPAFVGALFLGNALGAAAPVATTGVLVEKWEKGTRHGRSYYADLTIEQPISIEASARLTEAQYALLPLGAEVRVNVSLGLFGFWIVTIASDQRSHVACR